MSNLLLKSVRLLIRRPAVLISKVEQLNKNSFTVRTFADKINPPPLPKKKKWNIESNITWKSVAISSAVGCGLLGYMYYLKEKKQLMIEKERRRELGKAKIGGYFELLNSKGKLVKSDDFLGQWLFIYFGFTHCPDVCPDEVEKMVKVVDTLENEYNSKIQPLFISVDPERDTAKVIEKYTNEFSPKIIGLTGSNDQIAKACKAYRVYYSNGPKDQEDDYIVDHTIIIYLVDPDGLFVDYYGQTTTAEEMVSSFLINKKKFDQIKQNSVLPSFSIKSSNSAVL